MSRMAGLNGAPAVPSVQIDIEKVVREAVAREFSRVAAGPNGAPAVPGSVQIDIEKVVREAVAREFSRVAAGQNGAPQDLVRAQIDNSIRDADAKELRAGVDPVFPYTEIKNVLEIQNDPLYRAALKEWDRKEAYLGNRVDRREKASADLVNQIFNIVGFFSVFQGVVLTAVSQLKAGSTATCGVIWFPIVLSTVSAVVAIAGVSLKFLNLIELERSILAEKAPQSEASSRAHRLRGDGKEFFRFYKHTKEPKLKEQKSFHFSWICVVLSLVLFLGLFILSYFAILCETFEIHAWRGGLRWP